MKFPLMIIVNLIILGTFAGCREATFGGGTSNAREKDQKVEARPRSTPSSSDFDSGQSGDEKDGPMVPGKNPILNHCKSNEENKQTEGEGEEPLGPFLVKVSKCLETGKFFDYKAGKCRELLRPKNFSCTWPGVIKRLKSLNVMTNQLKEFTETHVLLSCAESSDGNRVMTQSVSKADVSRIDCRGTTNPARNVLSTCFTADDESKANPNAKTPEEHEKIVARCYKDEAQ